MLNIHYIFVRKLGKCDFLAFLTSASHMQINELNYSTDFHIGTYSIDLIK